MRIDNVSEKIHSVTDTVYASVPFVTKVYLPLLSTPSGVEKKYCSSTGIDKDLYSF